jgi:CHAT domain-containing protein
VGVAILVLALTAAVGRAQPQLEKPPKPAELTEQQKKRLEERDRLFTESQRQGEAGNLRRAIALLEKAAAIEREVFGDAHEKLVRTVEILAGMHELAEDFASARKAREALVAIQGKLYGKDHWQVASARLRLDDVGRLEKLDREGRLQLLEADQLARQSVQLYREGKFREALLPAERVVQTREKLLGKMHPDYATSLDTLAMLYLEMAEYAKAEPLFKQACDICKRALGPGHPDYAESLNNLAEVYRRMGLYAEALPLHEQARDIRKEAFGEEDPAYAQSLNNLAVLYRDMGDSGRALRLQEKAHVIRKRALGETHPLYGQSLNNLANLYSDMGDYAKALPLHEEACDIRKKTPGAEHPDYAQSLKNLAVLYGILGDSAKALRLHAQATDIYKKARHPGVAWSLAAHALAYRHIGDYAQAISLYEQAREIRGKLLGKRHPDYATILHQLALSYLAAGDKAKALSLLEEVCDIQKETLGDTHPSYALSLNNMGEAYREMGEYAEALPLFERARDILKDAPGGPPDDYASTLMNLATLSQNMGENAKAARFAHDALRVRSAASNTAFSAQNSRLRLQRLADYRWMLDRYLSVALPSNTDVVEIQDHVLAWKGAVAARQAEERIALQQPQLAPLLVQLRQARNALTQVSQSSPRDPKLHPDWVARIRAREDEKEKLETQLALKSAAFRRTRNVSSADVAAALPPDAAFVDLLEFKVETPSKTQKGRYDFEDRFLAFVLRKGSKPILIELGKAQPIDDTVAAWRKSGLKSHTPDASARKLDESVWQPIRKHLGDAKTVYLSPDGALAKFPFAALPGSKPDSFLLEQMTFVHVTSGRHLLELADERHDPKSSGLLAVGALDFGKPAAGQERWQALPGAEVETQSVDDAFRKQFSSARPPRVLTGGDIDVERLRRELVPQDGPRWQFLHLATHGFFQEPKVLSERFPSARPPRVPEAKHKPPDGPLTQEETKRLYTYDRNPLLSSGLVLSGANADPGKGVLTAEEVLGMDLRGVDLAVLSACETGLGKVSGGQGVQGLQLAFHTAGARSLVASLWQVNDAATSVLVEEFYANLWQKKLNRAEALRQAQLTVLRHPERVLARRAELVKRGVSEEALAARGLGKAVDVPDGGKVEEGQRRSPPAWWAAFLLSGDPATLD